MKPNIKEKLDFIKDELAKTLENNILSGDCGEVVMKFTLNPAIKEVDIKVINDIPKDE